MVLAGWVVLRIVSAPPPVDKTDKPARNPLFLLSGLSLRLKGAAVIQYDRACHFNLKQTASTKPGAVQHHLTTPYQYISRLGLISWRMVVDISSMDLVVVGSQRMPARRIMASASLTSIWQFSRDA